MKRTWKKFLKFIIESTAVILIIYGVFSAGGHIKAKKDAIKQQELAQQEAQQEENKQEEPVIENKKLSEIELNESMENLIEKYKGNNEIGIVYKNFSTGYGYMIVSEMMKYPKIWIFHIMRSTLKREMVK